MQVVGANIRYSVTVQGDCFGETVKIEIESGEVSAVLILPASKVLGFINSEPILSDVAKKLGWCDAGDLDTLLEPHHIKFIIENFKI